LEYERSLAMQCEQLIYAHIDRACPNIHMNRLKAVFTVASALQRSKNMTMASIGRKLDTQTSIKHKIKKVDRLEGNAQLHAELDQLYTGLSSYIFKYLSHDKRTPIIIDLCYLKDRHDIQLLSAEVATQGRSIPLYREVFDKNGLKGRAKQFLSNLHKCVPQDKTVVVIMDAGFGEDWLGAIEACNWHWLLRIRGRRQVKVNDVSEWVEFGKFVETAGVRSKSYNNGYIFKSHNRSCRLITTKRALSTRTRPTRLPRNYNSANGGYQKSAKEPWLLATNLPLSYSITQIINYYKKRMQIEESFRDLKSHQFGLSARYVRTRCIHRLGVKILLAAIVQVIYWVVGVIGHSQGMQKYFQANTVRDKKVFSYFYLGQLIIEHDKFKDLIFNLQELPTIIEQELAREW